jgi:hypothetical protein
VIAAGETQLEDIVVHGETGIVLERGELEATIAAAGDWAAARDAGVELAIATSWEPAARALLDALAAAIARREAVLA